MKEQPDRARYDQLVEELNHHSYLYYVLDAPVIQDDEYDALVQELMKAENPYNCPHGRPTLIRMTRYEFDRKFRRIV